MATPSMPQCSPHPTKDSFVITDDDPSVCSENPDTMDAMRQRLDPDRINDHDVILSYDNFQMSSDTTAAYDDGDVGGGDGTTVVNASTSAASSSSARHPLHLEQKLEHALSTIESLSAERDADGHIIESLTAELQQRLEREKREELQRRENPMPPLLVAPPPKKNQQQQQQRKNKSAADDDNNSNDNTNEQDDEQSSLLAELQSSLHSQMSRRAEAEERVRQISYKLTSLEDEVDRLQTSNSNLVSIRSKLENEISKLRTQSDESERREAVLNNRLNDARKKEALKYSDAHRFELENVDLKEQIGALTKTVDSVTNEMKSLVVSSDKLKLRCVERVKSAELALIEERKLNDERKQKMKLFVENKAEELKKAKHIVERVQKELDESRSAHRQTLSKLDSVNAEWESLHIQNQQLQQDLNQLRHDIDTKGDKLQIELERTALNAQEQKSKRMSATHELMTLLRKVEAERTISSKLREGIRYRLTPKASGQLKLLNDTLRDFENELIRLARRVGRPLPPPPTCTAGTSWEDHDDDDKEAGIGEKKPLYYGGFVGFGHNAAAGGGGGDNNGTTNNNDHHGVLNFAAATAAASSGIEPHSSSSSRRSSSMSNTPKSTSSSTHSSSSPTKSSGAAAAAGGTKSSTTSPDPSRDVLSTLESESENIGKGIEYFLAGVERMHLLLGEGDGRTQQQGQQGQQQQERSCMSAFAELVLGNTGGGAAGAAGMPMTSLLLQMAHGDGSERRRGSVMNDEEDENDEMVAMVSNGDDGGGLSSSSLGGNSSGNHYSPVSGRYYE